MPKKGEWNGLVTGVFDDTMRWTKGGMRGWVIEEKCEKLILKGKKVSERGRLSDQIKRV